MAVETIYTCDRCDNKFVPGYYLPTRVSMNGEAGGEQWWDVCDSCKPAVKTAIEKLFKSPGNKQC